MRVNESCHHQALLICFEDFTLIRRIIMSANRDYPAFANVGSGRRDRVLAARRRAIDGQNDAFTANDKVRQ